MRILFIGDVVGNVGVEMIQTYLPKLKRDLKPQATIVNGENSTPVGRGISQKNIQATPCQRCGRCHDGQPYVG